MTNEQYRALVPSHDSGDYEGNTLNKDRQPAVRISWDDINDMYLPKLTSKLDGGYKARFPAETEWEYACRAGTATEYYWGNNYDSSMCNSSESGNEPTTPVGSFMGNGFGLYDMSGNVLEWCADCYVGDAYSKYEVKDQPVDVIGWDCVLRGGSWFSSPRDCRSANRCWYIPDYWDDNIEVCVVIDLPSVR